MAEFGRADLDALSKRLEEVEGYLHIEEKRHEIGDLEARSVEPGFWDDADAARATMARLASARDDVSSIDSARRRLEDARAALELGEETGDEDLLAEAASSARELEDDLSELELSSWFTDELDHGDAIVSIANRNIVEAEIHTTNASLSVELPRVMPQVEMARILTDAALLAEKDDKIKTCDYLGVTAVEDGKLKHSFKLTCAPKHSGAAKRIALKQILTTLDENRVPLDEA